MEFLKKYSIQKKHRTNAKMIGLNPTISITHIKYKWTNHTIKSLSDCIKNNQINAAYIKCTSNITQLGYK